jgi:hypothetical protein
LHQHQRVARDRDTAQPRCGVLDLICPPEGDITMKETIRRIGVVLGLGAIIVGCGATDHTQEPSIDNGNTNDGEKEKSADIASTQEAITTGWTAYTSEEYPPIICDSASLMNQVQCSGSNCDNTRAYCEGSGGSLGASYWTGYFSEESTNYRYCNAGYWVTGLACTGSYCDNNALQCSYIYGISPINCYWTGWVSEEGGGLLSFGYHYYARGMQCSGSDCDNKRFYVCQTGL